MEDKNPNTPDEPKGEGKPVLKLFISILVVVLLIPCLYKLSQMLQRRKHEEARKRVQEYERRMRSDENDSGSAETLGSHLDDEEDDQKAEPMLTQSQARASFNLLENVST